MKTAIVLLLALSLTLGILVLAGDDIDSTKAEKTPAFDPDQPRVTGVGGIFFKSKDPAKMRAWYGEHFGMAINEYGSLFEFRSTDNTDEKGYLQWSPFSDNTTYFKPSEKDFMINYRVHKMEELLENLKAGGVVVLDTIETYEYGKFVHILDLEGNKLELWEPVDTEFTRLYQGKTSH